VVTPLSQDSLPPRDIIVVGASAGGLEALRALMGGLTPELRASVCVVQHVVPWSRNPLPDILSRWGPLPAAVPKDGDAVVPGRIYVAPADAHLIFDDGRIHIWHGPRENLHRPAINPTFRSAAVEYGPRVVGVVLSGAQDDGSAGLWWVKRHGGVAVVQDPDEAAHPSMPRSALAVVKVDHVLPVREIGPLLVRLTQAEATVTSNMEGQSDE
jgi:two-component system chemotaxis response regulator CheB